MHPHFKSCTKTNSARRVYETASCVCRDCNIFVHDPMIFPTDFCCPKRTFITVSGHTMKLQGWCISFRDRHVCRVQELTVWCAERLSGSFPCTNNEKWNSLLSQSSSQRVGVCALSSSMRHVRRSAHSIRRRLLLFTMGLAAIETHSSTGHKRSGGCCG